MKTFIILVKKYYILDAQIYTGDYFDNPYDDDFHWRDFTPTHFVGIFKGADEQDAILEASEETGFNKEILEAIEVI
jgi:hypothetical protein